MKTRGIFSVGALSLLAATMWAAAPVAQNPPPQTTAPPGGQRAGGGGGQRGGRGGIAVMTLSTSAWTDGAQIPVPYSQAGEEKSPPLAWTDAPEGTLSFALVVHDLDGPTAGGADDMLNWLVWNIPAASRALAEGVPQGPQLPDGTRQISGTGPYYRGPAAPASGPAHHYLFELYALDTMIDVPALGPPADASAVPAGRAVPLVAPATVRKAVVAAMATHIRGKGVMIGLFRRAAPTVTTR